MRRLTRRTILTIFVAVLLFPACGCRKSRRQKVEVVEEDKAELASVVQMANQQYAVQLVRGFHDLEQGSWRWTMGQFSITLRVPAGAAERGARLELKLNVPEPVIAKVGATRLSATISGSAVEPETYSKPGEYTYSRDVPAAALRSEAATVDFSLDKFIAAGVVEQRELGVIVVSAGLLAK
jgi:hypothetical protein